MYEITSSEVFDQWLDSLRDRRARARIVARLRRIGMGNLGDHKALGGGLHELRISYGPGYRVYFLREGNNVIVLLAGGDKSSQRKDIEKARQLADEWRARQ